MSLIHENNPIAVKSELEIFNSPPVQVAIEKSFLHPFSLKNTLNDPNLIFELSGSQTYYVDLKNINLYLQCKVTNPDGTALPNDAQVSLANNFFYSMWSQIDVYFGDKLVSTSSPLYAYEKYIENLLEYSTTAITTRGKSIAFNADENLDDVNVAGRNPGLVARNALMNASRVFELAGRVKVDVFNANNLLLSKIPIKIVMKPNTEAFRLVGAADGKLVITKADMFARRVQVSDFVQLGHEQGLLKGSAKYVFPRVEITTRTLAAHLRSHHISNLLAKSEVPSKIIIGLVKNSSFVGTKTENPFSFHHYNINRISLKRAGVEVAPGPIELNVGDGIKLNAYNTLLFNHLDHSHDSLINIDNFTNNHFLVAFNLTADTGSEDIDLIQHDELSLDLQFSAPLPHAVTVIVYQLRYSGFEISSNRLVTIDQ